MGRTTRVLFGLGLLTLTACSGSADPSPPPPSPSVSATPPSPTPSPSAPVMPDAAKAHTKAGAKAFVEYFWAVVNYATNTGNTDAIRALSVRGCKGCEGGVTAIDQIYEKGGSVRGGRPVLSKFRVDLLLAGDLQMAHVTVTTSFSAETIDMPGTADDETRTPKSVRDRLELLFEDGGWKVSQLVVLP
jgi:hypothetical protein